MENQISLSIGTHVRIPASAAVWIGQGFPWSGQIKGSLNLLTRLPPAGSLLVRSLLTEFKEQLYLVYTSAYDPDANRIEWLWRVSRRVVTHNHQRPTFELLLADAKEHFQTLARTPADVLRHIDSPFAPDKDTTQLRAHAA